MWQIPGIYGMKKNCWIKTALKNVSNTRLKNTIFSVIPAENIGIGMSDFDLIES